MFVDLLLLLFLSGSVPGPREPQPQTRQVEEADELQGIQDSNEPIDPLG